MASPPNSPVTSNPSTPIISLRKRVLPDDAELPINKVGVYESVYALDHGQNETSELKARSKSLHEILNLLKQQQDNEEQEDEKKQKEIEVFGKDSEEDSEEISERIRNMIQIKVTKSRQVMKKKKKKVIKKNVQTISKKNKIVVKISKYLQKS